MKTLELTHGERARLNRRRAKLKVAEAAAMCGISTQTLRRWETDGADVMTPTSLQTHEWCLVRRERAGFTLGQLSEMTGLGTSWINRAERGILKPEQVGALVQFWERQR
jgi:transcriptional regulator with XRE-family HTH domain